MPYLDILSFDLVINCWDILPLEGHLPHHQTVEGHAQGPNVRCLAGIRRAVCLLTKRFRSSKGRSPCSVCKQGVRAVKLITHTKIRYFDLQIKNFSIQVSDMGLSEETKDLV